MQLDYVTRKNNSFQLMFKQNRDFFTVLPDFFISTVHLLNLKNKKRPNCNFYIFNVKMLINYFSTVADRLQRGETGE